MNKNKITFDNFRDLGGLTTPDGHVFKSGKLFRTASLHANTIADKCFLDSLNIDSIIDFRTNMEIGENSDYVPNGTEWIQVSILQDMENSLVFTKKTKRNLFKATPEQMKGLLDTVAQSYREMPFSQGYNNLFERMDSGKTIAFHCTAGKDRTGIAAMLIELAFGRNIEDIKYEYMLSNKYREHTNTKIYRIMKLCGVKKHCIDATMYVLYNHEENFDIAINTILSKYPDFPTYLKETFNITPERIAKWKTYYLD